jgi:hypothetical protein
MQKDQFIQIRLTKEEKEKIEKKAKDNNFYSVSQYLRFIAIHGVVTIK